jgi:[acyl-carrier-protein] S-malonyltransferase
MKIGILFSGQGAQQVGMGADLYAQVPAFKQTIDQASEVLGYDLADLMANDAEKLAQTQYAQPAILAMSMGIMRALPQLQVVGGVGLSLGEYSALTAAGALDFKQAIALIQDRGTYMQVAGEANPGKMAAVMTEDQALVTTILAQLQADGYQVWAANYNTFQQLVIGGVASDVDHAVTALEAAGISRIVPLPVSGAFHTPLLQVAATKMQTRLADEIIRSTQYPIWSNTTKMPFEVTDIKDVLVQQVISPTYFAQALEQLLAQGVDTLIEVGPSDTLTKFARKIAPKEVKRYAITDVASFESVRAILQEEN